jgi:hypothetical protein
MQMQYIFSAGTFPHPQLLSKLKCQLFKSSNLIHELVENAYTVINRGDGEELNNTL